MRPQLPTATDELAALAEKCIDALVVRVEPVLEQLRSLQRDPHSFKPGRLCDLGEGIRLSVVVAITHGVDPRRDLNTSIGKAAAAVGELIEYFDIPDVERADLRATVTQLDPHRQEGNGTSWNLDGLWVYGDHDDGQEDVGKLNAVRLVALTAFFERAQAALVLLRQRIDRKLSPPQIRDRVQVDLTDCVVTVDGVAYQVTENQAILFHELAQLKEHEALSGTEIGARARVKGAFKAGLYRKQIKKAGLKKLISDPSTTPGRKFRLVLPPLPD